MSPQRRTHCSLGSAVALFAALAATFLAGPSRATQNANKHEFPWAVSENVIFLTNYMEIFKLYKARIQSFFGEETTRGRFCSATLIADGWLLTSAQCVLNEATGDLAQL